MNSLTQLLKMILPEGLFPNCSVCIFDKTPTIPIIIFEIGIILFTIISLILLRRIKKDILRRFFIVAIGIFIFEFFTSPLWFNHKMGWWAYAYQDVSWILTIMWSILILISVLLVDKYFYKIRESKRFFLCLLSMLVVGLLTETVVVKLGIRTYAPEALQSIHGFIPYLNIPIDALYYIPVFTALVIAFYKYWSFVIDKKLITPSRNLKFMSNARDFLIVLAGVFLFEYMIEPMVINANLPKWSYIYRDISILISGLWVVIVWLVTKLVDKFFIHFNLRLKFLLYVGFIGVIALPVEIFLMIFNYRIYAPSTVAAFSGFIIPLINIPVEVVFAIPFYFALVVGFARYWAILLDNKNKKQI